VIYQLSERSDRGGAKLVEPIEGDWTGKGLQLRKGHVEECARSVERAETTGLRRGQLASSVPGSQIRCAYQKELRCILPPVPDLALAASEGGS